jgi:hypothetical protein
MILKQNGLGVINGCDDYGGAYAAVPPPALRAPHRIRSNPHASRWGGVKTEMVATSSPSEAVRGLDVYVHGPEGGMGVAVLGL